jgi:7,8-dihydroneopterin aldolase/epimerase/oxygenase
LYGSSRCRKVFGSEGALNWVGLYLKFLFLFNQLSIHPLTIHLHNLLFHAFHGLYEHEQIVGNDFEVNVDIEVATQGIINDLHQTVNYVDAYSIIQQRMLQATPLLETLAQELAQAIHLLDKKITSVSITIKKLSPPIENFVGVVGVTYKSVL